MTTAQQERPVKTDADRERERTDRFRRVAGLRANNALTYMEKLLHTADTTRYSYSEAQAAEIVSKLRVAVDQVEAAYAGAVGERLRVEL